MIERAPFAVGIAAWLFALVMDLNDRAYGPALVDAGMVLLIARAWPPSRPVRTEGAS